MNAPDTAFPTTIGGAFESGFYAGRIRVGDTLFALVLSPAAGEIKPIRLAPSWRPVDGARSYCDGHANTHELAQAGSKIAEAALGLTIGGFSDWYIPARDELELIYRHFKPTTWESYGWRNSDNPSSIPAGYPYAKGHQQTTAESFRKGGANALEEAPYWSSTLSAPDPAYVWAQGFGIGYQGHFHHDSKFRARAVRRIPIGKREG